MTTSKQPRYCAIYCPELTDLTAKKHELMQLLSLSLFFAWLTPQPATHRRWKSFDKLRKVSDDHGIGAHARMVARV